MDTATARPSVFISYSRKDGKWLDALTTMLAPVVRAGIASVWWDKKIRPSQIWRQEIDAALASARLSILLVSPHFLASDFIQNEELPFLIDAAQRRDVKLLWVLVSPCLYEHSPLRDLQAAHDLAKPLSKLQGADRQEALANISRAVVEALDPEDPDLASPLSRRRGGDGRGAGGEGPFLHNLPYPRLGDLFTGRQEELDALARGGTAAITQSAAISGLGGIGKTRLAVEYAWRSGHRYTAAWFVRADSPENLRRNLAVLAGPELLNLPAWEARDEDKTVAAVKRSLREHPGWLMILDNVDTTEAAGAVLEVLSSLYKGHVLITSRLGSWPPEVGKQALEKLSQEEAGRFLLHRTEGGRETAADDAETAGSLAERVDGLPLALEQAAAFIVRHRMRLADYLQAWEDERERVLQWFDPQVMRYPASVAVTWQHTFQQLTPTAAALLRLTAFLAPDPIPVEIFEKGAEHLGWTMALLYAETGGESNRTMVREAVADLTAYSMVSRQDGGSLTVHRMVQEAVRNQIPGKHRREWIEGALRIVNDAAAGNPSDVRTWPLWASLRPHAAKVAVAADRAGILDPTSRLMNELGQYLKAKALYPEAEPLMRRALDIDKTSLGNDHPEVAIDLNNLAQLLRRTNRLGEAEPLLRRALEIDQAYFGNNHPNVASDLNNLAQLLKVKNRLDEAEPLMRRALEIDRASFGDDHPNVARDLNNLALLLQETYRVEEAEPLSRRALEIDTNSFGAEHPEVARDLNNLGQLLRRSNRLGEAEPLIRRALEIDTASLGIDHPSVARDLNNLAMLLKITNRLGEAEPLMRRALEIDTASLGDHHPNVAIRLSNLALLLQDTNRPGEAEPLMRRALEIDTASFGNHHPNVAIRLNNLALLLKDTNRLGEAEPLMRRALEIDEASFGPNHPEVATDLNNLALLFQTTNRLGEAERLMRRALAIDEVSFGIDHPNVAADLSNLALLLRAMARLGEAEPLMRRAVEIHEKNLGLQHPRTQKTQEHLAVLLAEKGRTPRLLTSRRPKRRSRAVPGS